MKLYFLLIWLGLVVVGGLKEAIAVPPPDFLFNVGTQIVQIFSVIVIFLSAILVSVRQFAKTYFINIKHKKLVWSALALIVIGVAFWGATWYQDKKENEAYLQWVAESQQNDAPELNSAEIDKLKVEDSREGFDFGDLPLFVTNENFQKAIDTGSIYVLDAREDEEYSIGYFPESHHIRFADLIDGKWRLVPDNQVVYVFCWSGIRGKEVAEFLRTKGVQAQYVQNGADDWVSAGGTWVGGIKFSEAHPESRYQKTFTTAQFKSQMANGAFIVDSRPKEKYEESYVPGAVNIPIIHTPTSKIDEVFAQVPVGSEVITICDDFVSCFDAKLVGLKLEGLGSSFLGRYSKPWEYK